ncbi:hypothetical protein [Kordiimonas marina]|uniref:hypothetical protein n=1 Tax=Kordiimonas marina TaxID=2872312 RepID=UPI001FF24049|nr:hypothetical protein [Kordiimonas marina]MCJ9428723.1 hypothetical protein [Kordiimonas marina]
MEQAVSFVRIVLDFVKRQKPFFWVIAIWLLCFVYFTVIASNRYAPEAQVYVKSIGGEIDVSLPSLSALGLGGGGGSHDVLLLRDYLLSRDILMSLDKKLGLKKHYMDHRWDPLSRLWLFTKDEDFLDYYRNHVHLDIDPSSGILRVRAEGFTPEFSLKLTQEMLKEGEDFINKVGHDVAKQQVKFVEGELKRARTELETASKNLLEFQMKHRTLSPEAESQSLQSIILSLKTELVRLRSEEKVQSGYLNKDAPELVATRSHIQAIEDQLASERAKVSGGGNGKEPIGELQIEYRRLDLRRQFAYDLYRATFTTLEKTRVDAYRKLKQLIVVQAPSLPEKEMYPRRTYNLVTIFVLLTLGYGILVLIVATVKEHRDV